MLRRTVVRAAGREAAPRLLCRLEVFRKIARGGYQL